MVIFYTTNRQKFLVMVQDNIYRYDMNYFVPLLHFSQGAFS